MEYLILPILKSLFFEVPITTAPLDVVNKGSVVFVQHVTVNGLFALMRLVLLNDAP